MILFSLGLPSPFGEWCEALTARFMKYSFGLLETIYADTLEQFALSIIKTSSPHVMVGSRQIVGPLWAALAQTNRGFIVAHDDPISRFGISWCDTGWIFCSPLGLSRRAVRQS